ncbi:MAG TPA: LuxR C-terminal-related transcriptional regulator [Flavobacterium sp.]|nr:LuxR C-terminal-related transcriptional regulator [Flavobacterium sp.]
MDNVNKLLHIWEGIPQALVEQVDLSQKEIISRYMDVFHFGDYFYVIFNTNTAQIEYIHPNIKKVLGYTAADFSLELALASVHPDDLPYYYHYQESAVRFFSGLSADLFFKYKFSYDYRMKQKKEGYKRILQQTVPIYYFPDGGVRTLVIFTDLTHLNIYGIPKLSFIGMQGAPSYYNAHLEDDFKLNPSVFSKKELEVLCHMTKGLKSEDIAILMKRSIYTIQTHRKNILRKSGCENVQELLVKSIREGWI